ncbi:MAG: hypothetical protein H7838_10555 [Magnetococcus sp. DMHC-8]
MGIAASAHPVTSPRRQPVPPPEGQSEGRSTKKCHYLPLHCRGCGQGLTIAYPLSVTFWKFSCTTCNRPYSIEIVGNRKCLVYEQFGRRTVERIGLTQERNTYYRARCYACNAVVIVSRQEIGKIQSCHQCRLDYTVNETPHEVFYETVIQHQGHPVTFRDKVQTLDGHILNKGNMFFLDEDIAGRTQQEWVETLAQLENELTALRGQDGPTQTVMMRLQAEKNGVGQQLRQQMAKAAELADRVRLLEQQTRALATEKQAYAERVGRYDEVVRHLEQKREQSIRLENRLETLQRTIRALTDEREALLGKLAGQTEALHTLEQEKAKKSQSAEQSHQAELKRLRGENQLLSDKINSYNELLRELERQTERAAKFEAMYRESETQVKQLQGDNHQLANRLTGQEAVLRDLERQTGKLEQLEARNRDLHKRLQQWQEKQSAGRIDQTMVQQWEQEKRRATELAVAHQDLSRRLEQSVHENRSLSERLGERENRVALLEKRLQQVGKALPDLAPLEARLRALQQENKRLALKAQEQTRLEARLVELEAEVNLLRQRGQERPEPREEWYCEEGEESCISPQEKGFQERRILGIKGEPTPERIKAALRKRIRKYHPDRVASMGMELRELAHRKTQEITRAYSQLMSVYGKG